LEKFNLCRQISAVSGTSVGALNAAMFAQGDLQLAEELWRNMATGDILHRTPENIAIKIARILVGIYGISSTQMLKIIKILRSRGVFSRDGLLKLMEDNLDPEKVTSERLPVFVTCRRKRSTQTKNFPLVNVDPQRMYSILLASSAIPLIFPPEKIDGEIWYDGGIPSIKGSNTPIQSVYDAGCRFIIAVLLDMDDWVDATKFPDAQILFIYPQKSNGALFDGALDFDGCHADQRMDQGFQDTMRILEPIFRMGVSQIRYEKALEIALQQQNEFAALTDRIELSKKEGVEAKNEALKAINELSDLQI
jgi:NTE family protein